MKLAMIPLVALLAIDGCQSDAPKSNAETQDHPRPVVSIIAETELEAQRHYAGTIVARTELALAFQTAGRMIARNVELGDTVTQDTVVAQLSPGELDDNARAAAADLDSARAALAEAEAEARRTDALVARGVAPRSRKESTDEALQNARAQVAQAAASLSSAEDASDFATLEAPISGVVTSVAANEGDMMQAGAPVLYLADPTSREVVIDLPLTAVETLAPGDLFVIRLPGTDHDPVEASLREIDPLADTSTRTRRAHLRLGDVAPIWRIGQIVDAQVKDAGNAQIVLPEAAFTGGEPPAVWRVNRTSEVEGTVERVPLSGEITLTGRPDARVRLPGDEIQSGDEIVIRGVNSLTDGQDVTERAAP
ncbi:efflux RND transporter periplasmic adaptor subunit [Paracoccaceae bacterium GXU_MW_L88]